MKPKSGTKEYNRQYYLANREKIKHKNREYRRENPDKVKKQRSKVSLEKRRIYQTRNRSKQKLQTEIAKWLILIEKDLNPRLNQFKAKKCKDCVSEPKCDHYLNCLSLIAKATMLTKHLTAAIVNKDNYYPDRVKQWIAVSNQLLKKKSSIKI